MFLIILKIYMIFLMVLLLMYMLRQLVFSIERLFHRSTRANEDICSSNLKMVTVLIPMHNEEKVASQVLDAILKTDYPYDYLEIIPINDNSTDNTKAILDEYAAQHSIIKPIHRNCPERGKQYGLNDAIKVAQGEIMIVLDADYIPSVSLIRIISLAFEDPKVGAVMGRVIPYNADKNMLTRLSSLERSGGYQVDQQARYNLGLFVQYGGTVGGFRTRTIKEVGGFDPSILAEDTDLTYTLYERGWKVAYANAAECYEETPETWEVRGNQIKRWARGHNQVMFKHFGSLFKSKYINFKEKIDGLLLLLVYLLPVLLFWGMVDAIILFYSGDINYLAFADFIIFMGVYSSFGNFAPFFEIGIGLYLDKRSKEALLLPVMLGTFFFNMWVINVGFWQAVVDRITRRNVTWAKTQRFEQKDAQSEGEVSHDN